jgi:hypothetical protein
MSEDHLVSAPQLPVERGRREAIKLYARRLWLLMVVIGTNGLLVGGIFLVKNVAATSQSGGRAIATIGGIGLVLASVVLILATVIVLLVEVEFLLRAWTRWGRGKNSRLSYDRSTAPGADSAEQDP